jgi:hypothetical protein
MISKDQLHDITSRRKAERTFLLSTGQLSVGTNVKLSYYSKTLLQKLTVVSLVKKFLVL